MNATSTKETLVRPGTPLWPDAIDELGLDAPHVLSVQGDAELLQMQTVTLDGAHYISPLAMQQLNDFVPAAVNARIAVAGDIDNPTAKIMVLEVARAGGAGVLFTKNPPGVYEGYPNETAAQVQDLLAAGGSVVSLAPDRGTAFLPQAFSRAVATMSNVVHVYEAQDVYGPPLIAEDAATQNRSVTVAQGDPIHDLNNSILSRLLEQPKVSTVASADELIKLFEAPLNQRGMDVPAQLEMLEFAERVRELIEAGRIDTATENLLQSMAADSTDLREFQARMHYGGARVLGAVEYRYLNSALETPVGYRPATWDESAAWVRSFGVDRYQNVNRFQQIEQHRETAKIQSYT